MADLIALDLAPGPAFVAALQRAWDQGAAALPIDPRLPGPARRDLLAALAPTAIIGADGVALPLADGHPTADGDALVMPTSGTTGAPKGVVLTHQALAAHARAVHARLEVDPATDRWLSCLPLAHMGGLGVVTRSLITGTPLEVLPSFDPASVEAAADRGATLVALVPTALNRLDPDRFRWIVLGGSADWRDRPANVVATYGLTETGGGVVYADRPLDGVELRIVDGEIQLRGPMLFRGYRAPGSDQLAGGPDAQGWLATGDLGALDAGGALRVLGRRSELIITGGENVWPDRVEAVLDALPAVAECAVAGRPDPDWGQRVVAWVVPADRAAPPTLDELRDAVRRQLPAFAAPRELVLVASLPRTALGKVRRAELGRAEDGRDEDDEGED